MIIDLLPRANLYLPNVPHLGDALAFLRRADLAELPDGRHEIAGDDAYASVSRYLTKPVERGVWEAHRRYIDLQCVLSGRERIGYAALDRLQASEYDPERDVLFAAGHGDTLTLEPGTFALLWPYDAHMPGLAVGEPAPVHKVVIKLAVK